jgi:nicotinamidase-related amidase
MLLPARPFPYPLAPGATALVVIDMQRDFIEPGGFGASLGNDVSRLVPAIAPIAALLTAWRARGITHLVFTGVTTEVCVQTSMREANDRGYDCLVVEDATESYFPEFKAATLAMLTAQGAIVGWCTDSRTLIEHLP